MRKFLSSLCCLVIFPFFYLSGQGLSSEWERLPRILPEADRPAGGGFGFSLDMHGNLAIIGAPLNSANGEEAGMAFIFAYDSGQWQQLAQLESSDAQFGDQFGFDVAITEDYAVVTARFGTGGQGFSGAAYVFEKPDSGWVNMTETAKLSPSDPEPLMLFGNAVDAEGDLILVGAMHKDQSIGEFFGGGYLYQRQNGQWVDTTETAQLTASDRSRGDRLAFSVALGDGRAFLGTPLQNAKGNVNAGSVYIYEVASGNWSDTVETFRIFSPVIRANEQFGASLAFADGHLVIGSPNKLVEQGVRAGGAYLFAAHPTERWASAVLVKEFSAPDPIGGEDFGRQVAISNGSVAVTSPLYAIDESKRGRVTIFSQQAEDWSMEVETHIVATPDNQRGDSYAVAVALNGEQLLVGASSDSDNPSEADRAGAVQFFNFSNTQADAPSYQGRIEHPILVSEAVSFGLSIALDSNIAVIGVPYSNYAARRAGAAFVYEYNGEEWQLRAALSASDPGRDELFGYDVAIHQNTVVVGSVIHNEIGAAYVFTKPEDGWADMTETAQLRTTDPGNLLLFGYKVDIYENTIVVATPEAFARGVLSGAAYVYEKPEAGWIDTTETVKLYPPIRSEIQRYGQSIDVYKNQIMVGATGHDDRQINEGAAYLYTRPAEGWQAINLGSAVHFYMQTAYTNFNFGYDLALTDSYAAVGAPNNNFNGRNNGLVYIFEKGEEGWESGHESALLFASDPGVDDAMGFSVVAEGDLVMAGAPNNNHTGNNSGAAYVFRKPADGWRNINQEAKVFPLGGFQQSNFGWSIDMSAGMMIAGSPRENNDLGDKVGAVYTFMNRGLLTNVATEPQNAVNFDFRAYLRPDGQLGIRLLSGQFPTYFRAGVIDLMGRRLAGKTFQQVSTNELSLAGDYKKGQPYIVEIMAAGGRMVKKVVLF